MYSLIYAYIHIYICEYVVWMSSKGFAACMCHVYTWYNDSHYRSKCMLLYFINLVRLGLYFEAHLSFSLFLFFPVYTYSIHSRILSSGNQQLQSADTMLTLILSLYGTQSRVYLVNNTGLCFYMDPGWTAITSSLLEFNISLVSYFMEHYFQLINFIALLCLCISRAYLNKRKIRTVKVASYLSGFYYICVYIYFSLYIYLYLYTFYYIYMCIYTHFSLCTYVYIYIHFIFPSSASPLLFPKCP